MNTTIAPPITKVAVTRIVIDRGEGLTSECISSTHTSWASAEERIRNICTTAPDNGGYNKCKFKIIWADGEDYEGRYEAARRGSPSYEGTLAKHCIDHLTFQAGLRCPAHLSEAKYDEALKRFGQESIDESLHFLKTYSFDDTMVTPQLARELVAELHQSEGPTVPEGASASESAGLHRAYVAKYATPMLPVVGNSYPVKNVLYAWGGRWDGTAKTWLVPAYKHAEAQAMVDKHTKQPVAKAAAAPLPKPAPTPVVTPPAPAPTKAPVKAKPAAPAKKFRTPIQKRYDALLAGMELLASDLPPGPAFNAMIRSIADLKDNHRHV